MKAPYVLLIVLNFMLFLGFCVAGMCSKRLVNNANANPIMVEWSDEALHTMQLPENKEALRQLLSAQQAFGNDIPRHYYHLVFQLSGYACGLIICNSVLASMIIWAGRKRTDGSAAPPPPIPCDCDE